MSISEGQLLRFIPPKLDGGDIGTKHRYMLVTKNDSINNIIEMINVSSIKGKEHKLIYNSNIQINNYYPLPVPTFAKLDTVYKLENFEELSRFIYFDGEKINKEEFERIFDEKYKYTCKYNKNNTINFTKKEFLNINILNSKI